MGIRGLFRYISEKFPQLAEPCDLKKLAEKRGGIELIIDFYAFEYWLLQQLSELLASNEKNPWVELSGGEYSVIHSLLSSILKLLRQENINPTFVMDGAKFSTNAQATFKYSEWIRRDINDYTRVKKMLEMVGDAALLGTMNRREFVRPVLVEIEIIRCIKELGVEIHCCCSGEADMYIAKLFADRGALAIITNDSDFLLFPSCSMISIDTHFDVDNHLRDKAFEAHRKGLEGMRLERLEVRCIMSTKVHMALSLGDIGLVCDFAFVRGNDASKHFTDDLHKALKLNPNNFVALIDFITNNRPLRSQPIFAEMCTKTDGFLEAYEVTHAFYRLDFARLRYKEEKVVDAELEEFICTGVSRLDLSPNFLAISRGYHWCRVLVELINFRKFAPVSEVAMGPFRSFLYQMLVSRELPSNKATEFVVLPRIGMQETQIAIPCYEWLPKLNQAVKMSKKARLEMFHRILSSLENFANGSQKAELIYMAFTWPEAFKVYVCRYFLLLNFRRNLHLNREEMLTVIACVFGCTDSNIILTHSIPCRPSPRSLTVGAWLQNVYRYAGGFLAQILDLEAPLPSEFFSGALFTAFYYCDSVELGNVPESNALKRICNIKGTILRTYVRELGYITQNCW